MLFEQWAFESQVLRKISGHYREPGAPPLPEALIASTVRTKHLMEVGRRVPTESTEPTTGDADVVSLPRLSTNLLTMWTNSKCLPCLPACLPACLPHSSSIHRFAH